MVSVDASLCFVHVSVLVSSVCCRAAVLRYLMCISSCVFDRNVRKAFGSKMWWLLRIRSKTHESETYQPVNPRVGGGTAHSYVHTVYSL